MYPLQLRIVSHKGVYVRKYRDVLSEEELPTRDDGVIRKLNPFFVRFPALAGGNFVTHVLYWLHWVKRGREDLQDKTFYSECVSSVLISVFEEHFSMDYDISIKSLCDFNTLMAIFKEHLPQEHFSFAEKLMVDTALTQKLSYIDFDALFKGFVDIVVKHFNCYLFPGCPFRISDFEQDIDAVTQLMSRALGQYESKLSNVLSLQMKKDECDQLDAILKRLPFVQAVYFKDGYVSARHYRRSCSVCGAQEYNLGSPEFMIHDRGDLEIKPDFLAYQKEMWERIWKKFHRAGALSRKLTKCRFYDRYTCRGAHAPLGPPSLPGGSSWPH